MIRVVNLNKAIIAGAAGAAVMELCSLLATQAGLPAVDFVRELSSIAFDHSPLLTTAAALATHLSIGICWAVFYAFLFWGRLRAPPTVQGLVFGLLPAVLAIFIVYPELALIRQPSEEVHLDALRFLSTLSFASAASLLVAHLLFGLTIGAIYRRPVGYPADRKPSLPKPRHPSSRPSKQDRQPACAFMFATGIECSYPTIEHGRWRRDEMDSTSHYSLWQRDFALAREIGITHIRYGPPLHLIFEGPGRYNWEFADPQMEELRDRGPEPIVDLCHFGVPSWLGNLQNPDIAQALAEYAGAFADRYPWVRFYTPVNEMYVCARMSALDGLWNEQLRDEGAYARAAWNLANASIRMSDAILKRRSDAVFINSESSEFYQPCCPDEHVQQVAEAANERRFLPLDLIYAHELNPRMRKLLCEQGIAGKDIDALAHRAVPRRSILGIDYYEWNERLIDRQGNARALGELFGWYVIAS